MMVREGEAKDIPAVLELIQEFIKESRWGWKYDEATAISTLSQYIEDDECELLIVEEGDILTGWAIVAHDFDFHVEPLGYVIKFYISKQARGTKAGRELLKAITEWFDFYGCVDSFATDTGNIAGQGRMFTNLFKKAGYTERSNALVRRNPNHE